MAEIKSSLFIFNYAKELVMFSSKMIITLRLRTPDFLMLFWSSLPHLMSEQFRQINRLADT